MLTNKLTNKLAEKGLPRIWQYYIAVHATLAIIIGFVSNENLLYTLTITNHFIMFFGLVAGYQFHKEHSYPRLLVVTGAGLIVVAKIMESFVYIGFPIYPTITFLIEEQGIGLITLFAFYHMQLFENKFNMKGFSIDYSLLLISFLFFFLLISPTVSDTLFYKFTFIQQILFINIFIGLTLLTMAIIHYFITKSVELTDGIRLSLTILLVFHFSLDLVLTFDINTNRELLKSISLSSYHLAGALAIAFIILEKFPLDYPAILPSQLGNLFMWVASIIAIIAIPLGLVIRSLFNAPPISLLLIGIAGSILSIVVIWRFILLIRNANDQKDRLRTLIHTNNVTGLPNYNGYLEKITLSQATNLLVVSINIEDFKSINDLYGRDSADEILKSLASRIKKLPNTIVTAHTHSDTFLVVYRTKNSEFDTILLVENLQRSLGVWDNILGKSITVPLTFGASYSLGEADPEKLAKQAEEAQKNARSQRVSLCFYTESENSNKLPRHEVRDILQQAIDDNYLPVHFQPIYKLDDGSLKALELLIRVESSEHGLLPPHQFLDQAKEYGLLTSLTRVCVKMVAKHYKDLPNVTININLPPYMLKNSSTLNNFVDLFREENLPPNRFCIEITEDEDIPATEITSAISLLKKAGFTIAMDDFGTGYSSLDRLSTLSVDTVKIDRSILLTADSGNTAILEWAISLAKRLGVSAVVEGVETKKQLSLVKKLGADSVQGFLYSKPIPAIQLPNIAMNSDDIIIA